MDDYNSLLIELHIISLTFIDLGKRESLGTLFSLSFLILN